MLIDTLLVCYIILVLYKLIICSLKMYTMVNFDYANNLPDLNNNYSNKINTTIEWSF